MQQAVAVLKGLTQGKKGRNVQTCSKYIGNLGTTTTTTIQL